MFTGSETLLRLRLRREWKSAFIDYQWRLDTICAQAVAAFVIQKKHKKMESTLLLHRNHKAKCQAFQIQPEIGTGKGDQWVVYSKYE